MSQKTNARPRRGRDLTTGSIPRLVAVLSAPTAAEALLHSLAGLVHAYWMGRVGGHALAALSLGMTLQFLFLSPLIGTSSGIMAVVARHIGAREQVQADRALMQGILLFLTLSVPLIIVGVTGAPLFLRWMGATGDVHASAVSYGRILLAGVALSELPFTLGSAMRGAGHPEYSLYTSGVVVAVTILVESVLGLELGPFGPLTLNGAAWAALIGAAAGLVAQALVLVSGRAGLRLHLCDLRFDWSYMVRILRIGVPSGVKMLSPSMANALLMRVVASFGTTVLTAYALITRVTFFVSSFGIGSSSAAASMVGQSLGACKPERAAGVVRCGVILTAAISLLLSGLLNLLPRPILGVFSATPDVVALAVVALRFWIVTTLATDLAGVISTSLMAAGDAVAVMVISIVGMWGGQLGLAWLFSTALGMGPVGVWLGIAAGCSLALVVYGVRWRGGTWRAKSV